jgi:hypothetical protein
MPPAVIHGVLALVGGSPLMFQGEYYSLVDVLSYMNEQDEYHSTVVSKVKNNANK